jgi:hypothetical protein
MLYGLLAVRRSHSSAFRKSIMMAQMCRKTWNTDKRPLEISLYKQRVWLAFSVTRQINPLNPGGYFTYQQVEHSNILHGSHIVLKCSVEVFC